jgi:adenylate kinase family enzyme
VHARDRWIFEGGHSVTWPERLARADALVWLDLPVALRQWRVLRRTLLHLGETRPDLPDGCPERLDAGALEFWRYIWRSRRPARARMAALFAEAPPGTMRVRLRSGREVRRFLDRLGQPAGPANPPASVASKTAR